MYLGHARAHDNAGPTLHCVVGIVYGRVVMRARMTQIHRKNLFAWWADEILQTVARSKSNRPRGANLHLARARLIRVSGDWCLPMVMDHGDARVRSAALGVCLTDLDPKPTLSG